MFENQIAAEVVTEIFIGTTFNNQNTGHFIPIHFSGAAADVSITQSFELPSYQLCTSLNGSFP